MVAHDRFGSFFLATDSRMNTKEISENQCIRGKNHHAEVTAPDLPAGRERSWKEALAPTPDGAANPRFLASVSVLPSPQVIPLSNTKRRRMAKKNHRPTSSPNPPF